MSAELQLEKPAPKPVDRKSMGSGQVERLCRLHFAPPHFAFLTQVRNGTGFQRSARTADAVAMGTWPSRGIHLHGIEIKVDLRDFKREIALPEKAEDIAKYCHFWWLAVTHEKVAPLEMIPTNWGLLVVSEDGTKMRVAKDAAKLTPIPPDHLLLASIMRKMAEEYIHVGSLNDWKADARRELEQAADRNSKFLRETAENGLKKQTELIGKIETALGCRINEWNVDGFVADFELAKKMRASGWQVLDAIERLIKLTDAYKPHLETIKGQFDQKEKL